MAINRRTAITSSLSALALCALPLKTQGQSIGTLPNAIRAKLETYLNDLTTLQARFSQISPNGELATGLLQLSRPGQLKIDYDAPSKIQLIAPGDWRLIFYDGSIQQVNTIPLSQTPLAILLAEQIELAGDVTVGEFRESPDEWALTLARSDAPEAGTVALVFQRAPLELRRWTVVDAQGLSTTIILETVESGVDFDSGQFHWRDPKIFGFPED